MAYKTAVSNETIRKIILVITALPLVTSSNIDCNGKAFHCVNSTHFMICVDLGGGVSSTIDNFIIPCPPSTVCQETNNFECEFPRSTTPITEISVLSELRLSEITTVTDGNIVSTASTERISEVQPNDINLNTVSITTLQADSVTTNKPVTDSFRVENTATTDYTNMGYTLTTAPNDVTTNTNMIDSTALNPSNIEYSVTETSAPFHQETVTILIIDEAIVTKDPIISGHISAIDKSILDYSADIKINKTVSDQSATETFTVKDTSSSFNTEKDTNTKTVFSTTSNEPPVVENKLPITNIILNNDLYQNTTKEIIDTTVDTTTTVANIDISSTNTVNNTNFIENNTTESIQFLNDIATRYSTQYLIEAKQIINTNLSEVSVTTDRFQGSDLIVDPFTLISVTEQYATSPEPIQDILTTDISKFGNENTSELIFIDNYTIHNNDVNITAITGITSNTMNAIEITEEYHATESMSQASIITNNVNKNEEIVFTTPTLETTTPSILMDNTVVMLNQDTREFTQDGLTTTRVIITESNTSKDKTTSVSVTEPVTTIRQFENSETNNEIYTTSYNIESSTNSASTNISPLITTLNNIYTAPSEDIISSNNFVGVNTSKENDITTQVNIINTQFTNSDLVKTTTEGTLYMSSINERVKNKPIQFPERNENKYSITGYTKDMFYEMVPTIYSLSGSQNIHSVQDTIVEENITESPDIKMESTVSVITQNLSRIHNILQNVSDPTKGGKNSIFVTESYTMTKNVSIINDITTSLSVNDQDHTLITTVTDIPNKINQNINTTELYQESTTAPSLANLEVTIVGDTYISAPDINYLDSYYIVESMTTETNNFDQTFSGDTLSTATGLKDTIHDNDTATNLEDNLTISNFSTIDANLITNSNYQVESITTTITGLLTNADTSNKKDYATVATTIESQMFTSNLNETSATATNEALTEISLLTLPLNSEILQSTATEPAPMNPALKTYGDMEKLKVETERTLGKTMSNYTFSSPPVEEETNILINNYDQLRTVKPLMPDDISISNKSSPNQVFLQNNTEFKLSTMGTTQSFDNQTKEFGNTIQQITKYDLPGGTLSKTYINTKHDTRNISHQLDNLSTLTERTADNRNIDRLNENINPTETLNTNTMVGDETFTTSNLRIDSSTALSIDDYLLGKSIIIENIKNVTRTGNVKTTDQIESPPGLIKEHVNSNLQPNKSVYFNTKENILDKENNISELPIITNEKINKNIDVTSTDSTNKSFLNEFDISTRQVAIENYRNEYNIDNAFLADHTKDGLSLDKSQNNATNKTVSTITENTRYAAEKKLEHTTINDNLSPNQKLGQNEEGSTINESLNQLTGLDHKPHLNIEGSITKTFNNTGVSFNKTKVMSKLNNVSLNQDIALEKKLSQKAEASKINTINYTNVSLIELQATSMPIEGSLRESLPHDQTMQNAKAKEMNTLNNRLATNTINKSSVSSTETNTTMITNDGYFKHLLISDGKIVQNMDSSLSSSDSKSIVTEKTNLPLSGFSKDSVHSKLDNDAEDQKELLLHSENTAAHTSVEVTTAIPIKNTVKYSTQSSKTNLTNSFNNDQKRLNSFCFTRYRGRYADREDCTKFYICIGKTEPIVGKCPINTVFSEIKKQCTKNKSHCIRGNEFLCLSEGRFSDILQNNAYYICVKRQNNFIRFKFQCQNGYYLNKITVRCTKQLETVNQFSTSLDSEKSVSEAISKETNKSKNSKKESKSGEEFECKKEGKFADTDNCRKFYVCTKTKKSEFRIRRKSCDSDEVFHKDKKKCVDADSYEC